MATKSIVSRPIAFEVTGGTQCVDERNSNRLVDRWLLMRRCVRCAAARRCAEGHVPARRRADPEQGGLHVGDLPRRGQGQERLQALAARVRSAIRLRSAAVRSVGPPLQSRRPGAQPDAGQADAAGGARRRTAFRDRLATTTRPSTTGSRRACRSAIPPQDTVARLEVEPKEIFMNAPGESAAVKVTAIYRRRRHARRHARSRSSRATSRTWRRSTDAAVKGARTGEATLLVRYQGKFATLPVTVLNPKPGFAWKPLPQNNYIDRADRCQAAAAEDSAVARGGRCRLSCAASRSI